MLYSKYETLYYQPPGSRHCPVRDYIANVDENERRKIRYYIFRLEQAQGRLVEPLTKHIKDKIWELRIKFSNKNHRILYFIGPRKKIILLSAFLKKSNKTPTAEIEKAHKYYLNYLSIYEKTPISKFQ